MTDKFKNRYRISSARLQNWNYGWNGFYFVTICTKNRECFFGEIINGMMVLSEIGEMAHKYWIEISNHFPFLKLDAFVVMPNHMHGIIVIDKKINWNDDGNDANIGTNIEKNIAETRQCLVSATDPTDHADHAETIGQKRFQNQGKHTLSSIIGSYKSVVTKNACKIHTDFAWQSRFHDHIIRNDKSYHTISEYIVNNPSKWYYDKFNPNKIESEEC